MWAGCCLHDNEKPMSRRAIFVPANAQSPHLPESNLGIVVARRGTTTSIELDGQCDISARASVRDAIGRALAGGPECVVLDLGRLSFIDVIGVRLVLELTSRSRAQHVHLVICPGARTVQQVFDLCQVTEALPFIPSPVPREPRDPVSLATGDAGSGGALSSRPQRRRSPVPTFRRPARCQPVASGSELNRTPRSRPGHPS
jgi:anti-anti-sigma factor